MITKLPFIPDWSHYVKIPDMRAVNPKPRMAITKATEGNYGWDSSFLSFWKAFKENGIPRGAYHYFIHMISAQVQAGYFTEIIARGGVNPDDLLVIDVEDGGIQANEIIVFLNNVEAVYPHNQIVIYSSKVMLDTVTRTLTQIRLLNKYPLWLAWYPTFPDTYSWIIPAHIPSGWGPVVGWQYSDKGQIAGVSGDTDMNIFTADFLALFPQNEKPPEPPAEVTHTQPYPNVDEYIEVVNGEKCHVTVIKPDANTRFRVTHFHGALGYVSQSSAQIAFNGQDYDKLIAGPRYPQGMAFTDGEQYTPQQDQQWFMDIGKDNVVYANFKNALDVYNLTSFIRPLVIGGKPNPDFSVNPGKLEYTEIHARAALGYTPAGEVVQIVAEGKVDPTTGVAYRGIKLPQLADLFIKYHAIFAGEHGGGGDSGKQINGVMVNEPSDPTERAVVQIVEVFITGATTMKKYKVVWQNGVTKRPRPTTSAAGGVVLALNAVVDVLEDNIPDETYPTDPTKLWVKFTDNTYGASIYGANSERMIDVTPVEPPPTTGNKPIEVSVTLSGYKPKTFTGELEPE